MNLLLNTIAVSMLFCVYYSINDPDSETEDSGISDKLHAHGKAMKLFDKNWNSHDVENVNDCKRWTVENVNAMSPSSCRGFTAICLKEFDVSRIQKSCLEYINSSEVKNIEPKTIEELVVNSIDSIPADEEWARLIVEKLNWEESANEYAKKLSSRKDLLKMAFDTYLDEPQKLTRIMNKKMLSFVPPQICVQITKNMIEQCDLHAFRNVSPACFKKIPDGSFRGFTPEKFYTVNPMAIEEMTKGQADELSDEIIISMKRSVAMHWGRKMKMTTEDIEDKEEKKIQAKVLNEYIQNHPCMSLKGMKKEKIKAMRARKAINDRCTSIWKSSLGIGLYSTSSLISLGLATGLVMYLHL